MNTAATHPSGSQALLQRLRDYEQLVVSAHDEAARTGPGAAPMTARLRIGGDALAVPLARIRSVIRAPAIVEVPGTPEWLRGALRVGHQMMAVVAGEWVAGTPRATQRRGVEIAVILDLGASRVAVLVDAVDGLHRSSGAPHDDAPARELDLKALGTRILEQRTQRSRGS